MLCTIFTAWVASEPGGTKWKVRHSAKMLVCSTHLFPGSHPRNHPADPPEHSERPVGFRPNRGRSMRSACMFCNHRGREGVKAVVHWSSRRMVAHLSDVICFPAPGEQYLSTKRLAIRRFTASVPVARCSIAGPSPRSSAATYGPPLGFARLWCASHEGFERKSPL
jgi:hypothetical protein